VRIQADADAAPPQLSLFARIAEQRAQLLGLARKLSLAADASNGQSQGTRKHGQDHYDH
jgi:hypothetical protein